MLSSVPPPSWQAESSGGLLGDDDDAKSDADRRVVDDRLARVEDYREQLMYLTMEREEIAEAMLVAIERSDDAAQIVDVIMEVMRDKEAPPPLKIACLFLFSDILHNCSAAVANAWRYRSFIETKLPEMFECLSQTYRSIHARLKAEQFRKYVLNVVRVWEGWMIYPQAFLTDLANVFLKKPLQAKSALDAGKPTSDSEVARDSAIPKMDLKQTSVGSADIALSGPMDEDEDIDGVPRLCSLL